MLLWVFQINWKWIPRMLVRASRARLCMCVRVFVLVCVSLCRLWFSLLLSRTCRFFFMWLFFPTFVGFVAAFCNQTFYGPFRDLLSGVSCHTQIACLSFNLVNCHDLLPQIALATNFISICFIWRACSSGKTLIKYKWIQIEARLTFSYLLFRRYTALPCLCLLENKVLSCLFHVDSPVQSTNKCSYW